MYNFEALNKQDRDEMLLSVGVKSIDELFEIIPKEARAMDLPLGEPKDEREAQKYLKKLSSLNKIDYLCFLGGGARKRYIPSLVSDISSRFEFLSCYTPYQAEISQGTLRVMYEFQSLICTLLNQDVSNASVYDGATASAESILMAARLKKRNKVFVYDDVNPNYLEVIKTYLWANDIELITGKECFEKDLCARVYESPNRFGELKEMPVKSSDELIIAIVDILPFVLFEPPSADITVGDVQSLGINLNFGGAYAGFIACKDAYKRQLPGRISGKTIDKNGKTAYCLTLQAREQHIRREKATSNICSNQALVAFCTNLYLRKIGKTGLIEIANRSFKNAHKLADKLKKLGFEINNKEFYDEFTMNTGCSDKFLAFMKDKGILAGLKIDKNNVLVSVSELFDDEEIGQYISCAEKFSFIRI